MMKEYLRSVRNGSGAPLMLMAILALIIVPIPPFLLDMFFVINIAIALIVLLTCINIHRPLDFSIFPTVLLFATMLRLSLNVASTRRILMSGDPSSGGAGEVISSFGSFVIGNNFVVGLVVFLILMIINYFVVTKGSERISEVSARFNLDSLPGKQMAVDADLNSGQINQEQASARRKLIEAESQFHGNMDGATKFVKGDAIAGAIILVVNILGGLLIGIMQNDMSAAEATKTFVVLSIGDGLVAILPSIALALATAIIVTRVNSDLELSDLAGDQLLASEKTPAVAGLIIFSLGLIPSMPNQLFLLSGSGLMALGYWIHNKKQKSEQKELDASKKAESERQIAEMNKPKEVSLEDIVEAPLIHIRLGLLLGDICAGSNSPLMSSLRQMQKKLSCEAGVLITGIAIDAEDSFQPHQYQIDINGLMVGSGSMEPHSYLAVPAEDNCAPIEGIKVKEPIYGMDAYKILDETKMDAEIKGYEVMDAACVIMAHVQKCIVSKLDQMVDIDSIQKQLDNLALTKPKLVGDAMGPDTSPSLVLRVVKQLLEERVPVNKLSLILECVARSRAENQTFEVLMMHTRKALCPYILSGLTDEPKDIQVIAFSTELNEAMSSAGVALDGSIPLEPKVIADIYNQLESTVKTLHDFGYPPILLVNPLLRRALFEMFGTRIEDLHVLGFWELPKDVSYKIAKIIGN